jgi:urease beta subunit
MTCPEIVNPARCEIRVAIHFLYAKNMRAGKIHRELCAGYGLNVMSEETVRQLCRRFKDGLEQTFTLKSELVGHL